MIIEILDNQDGVITKVANAGNPADDVALYGGASWRPYTPSADEELAAARLDKIAEVLEHRKETLDNAVDDAAKVAETLYLLWDVFNTAGADPKWQLAYDIWAYAKTKVNQINAWPIDQVEAYDPATDPSWPV